MFDGNWFTGPCWDASHDHPLPADRQSHLDATLKLCQKVHQVCPDLIIELHDPIIGPGVPRYVPTYLLHAKEGSFDELWGYEFMILPMEDIDSRRAICLYYVNLAYSIPMYLHIDLRKDNDQALMFWWYASTCRHLGFGGKHADPKVWQAHKDAMKTYLRLKPFFTHGEFYGIDEMTHVHTLPARNAAVIICYNLDEQPVDRSFQVELSEVALAPDKKFKVKGAQNSQNNGNSIQIKANIPARGITLLEVIPK